MELPARSEPHLASLSPRPDAMKQRFRKLQKETERFLEQ